jgi:hypothetical protein
MSRGLGAVQREVLARLDISDRLRWTTLREQNIRNTRAVAEVISLRGKVSSNTATRRKVMRDTPSESCCESSVQNCRAASILTCGYASVLTSKTRGLQRGMQRAGTSPVVSLWNQRPRSCRIVSNDSRHVSC